MRDVALFMIFNQSYLQMSFIIFGLVTLLRDRMSPDIFKNISLPAVPCFRIDLRFFFSVSDFLSSQKQFVSKTINNNNKKNEQNLVLVHLYLWLHKQFKISPVDREGLNVFCQTYCCDKRVRRYK